MRRSKPGNSVYLTIGVWYDKPRGEIRLTAKADGVKGFHTTVSKLPGSKRGHPNLFMKLAKCLKAAGAPYPQSEE